MPGLVAMIYLPSSDNRVLSQQISSGSSPEKGILSPVTVMPKLPLSGFRKNARIPFSLTNPLDVSLLHFDLKAGPAVSVSGGLPLEWLKLSTSFDRAPSWLRGGERPQATW